MIKWIRTSKLSIKNSLSLDLPARGGLVLDCVLASKALGRPEVPREREFFIDNLLVRIHYIIAKIRWTGLAPWEFEFPLEVPSHVADEVESVERFRCRAGWEHFSRCKDVHLKPWRKADLLKSSR